MLSALLKVALIVAFNVPVMVFAPDVLTLEWMIGIGVMVTTSFAVGFTIIWRAAATPPPSSRATGELLTALRQERSRRQASRRTPSNDRAA